ncbi:MAG: ABC-ATPase domain-containing protein [Lachnospiraceae bacterium]|nr:ABC-ATPase domain-containing protein [Lachnospiraceae bacterium]
MKKLEQLLYNSDHKPYPVYKNLKGTYFFPEYSISVEHVQGDPFAAPSSLSIKISANVHGFPDGFLNTKHRRIALQDYLLRNFHKELKKYDHKISGSGKSGLISISSCNQEILERSALSFDRTDKSLTVRFNIGFPAAGRTTLALELKKILFDFIPLCISKSLKYTATDIKELNKWINLSNDQKAIREQLKDLNLIAFVANGSILPRKSGVDDRPMQNAVKFTSSKEDEVTLNLPNNRSIKGLGIKEGITLIVGGGYHGKSTLLKALERGVYDHIPGDGREYVITEDSAMKLRAEDGRSIIQTDISAFICDLPNGKNTMNFNTEDASGSTSQAASTVEAILSGAHTLLIDEDTSATNFLVRDALMHKVISAAEEPIIPFITRMQQLYTERRISTILVAGSCGTFFNVSDNILQMKNYNPINITFKAKETALNFHNDITAPNELPNFYDNRIPIHNNLVADSKKVKIRGQGTNSVSINHECVELRFVEQLTDNEQTNLLGALLRILEEKYFNGKNNLMTCLNSVYNDLEKKGFIVANYSGMIPGNYAMIRFQELYAMICRYRGLNLK